MAVGPLAAAFRAPRVGEGRFIIYDPDEFYTDQLYALGQTDLNVFHATVRAARATRR